MSIKTGKARADHTAELPRNHRNVETLNKSVTDERIPQFTDIYRAPLRATSNGNWTRRNSMYTRLLDEVALLIGVVLIVVAYASCLLQLA